jgi:lysophospholipase L1-like esterase
MVRSQLWRAVAGILTVGALLAMALPSAVAAAPLPHGHGAIQGLAHSGRTGAGARPGQTPRAGRMAPSTRALPAGDEIVTGTGDLEGWHLLAASSGDGWRWHPLATLRPAGSDGERWIGQQCLTGDGRFVIAVVAPWHANNSGPGMDRGGIAYAVNARTGQVRALATGVSLAYFDPGCGTGHRIALTTYLGSDEQTTRVTVLDARTGALVRSSTLPGELTSAVPLGSGIAGVHGGVLVSLAGTRQTALARVPGLVYDLRPDSTGGADFLAARSGTAALWRIDHGGARELASGPLGRVHLFAGRAGHNIIAGAARRSGAQAGAPLADGLRWLTRAPAAVSALGRMELTEHGRGPAALTLTSSRSGSAATSAAPPDAARAVETVPRLDLAAAGGPVVTAARPSARATGTTPPACAVPREDLWNQVPQPNSAQIQWAVQQAVRGWLVPGDIPARPAAPQDYEIADSQPLPTFYPNVDFPPPAIAGNPGAVVPPQVIYGILAQESNWNQASWHALAGYGGDPLVANYYGSSDPANPTDINYAKADCGYGVAQITDLMRAGAANVNTQTAIAVDYAENIAAAVTNLVGKWNQLASLGDLMNGGDPATIEDWYGAIWAYNSGVHMVANGDQGNGLGWRNNPANPIYPVDRGRFNENSGDATHPQYWPYQEKVFGWIEDGLVDPNSPSGASRFPGIGNVLNIPKSVFFCSTTVNHCNPLIIGANGDSCQPGDPSCDPCPTEDFHCWWNAPVQWANCPNQCNTGSFTISSPTAPEPAPTNRGPHCADLGGLPLADTLIVDDTALTSQNPGLLHPNVVGCPVTNAAWSQGGTFQLDSTGGAPLTSSDEASIDVHQLGAGFAGHTWFTHTRPAADSVHASMARWTPNLTSSGIYEIRAYIPTPGATTTDASYLVDGAYQRTVNQNNYNNQWISLGFFPLHPGSSVTLSSVTSASDQSQGADIAFNAMAFIRVRPGSYVAMGDSYSSGEGSGGPWDEGTDVQAGNGAPADNLCHRSPAAYPRQYAAMTQTFATTPVAHIACAGSNLYDLDHLQYSVAANGTVTFPSSSPTDEPNPNGGGTVKYGEPESQVDVLRQIPGPKLVTVTLGGNDTGFGEIVTGCAVLYFAWLINPTTSTCQQVNTNPDGSDRISKAISGLQQPITKALQDIKAAVPADTTVVVLTYPAVISGTSSGLLCSPLIPSDLPWLIDLTHELNQTIITAARTAGVGVLDEEGAFAGHELCSSDPWAKGADNPLQTDRSLRNNYFHPNTAGYAREARDLHNFLTGIP